MNAMGEVRFLLRPAATIVAGKYYDRPAPAHILNNFVLRSARQERWGRPHSFAVQGTRRPPEFAPASGRLRGAWSDEPESVNRLRESIRIVFDPDRRVFPSVGSPCHWTGASLLQMPLTMA